MIIRCYSFITNVTCNWGLINFVYIRILGLETLSMNRTRN
ncbi:MAG: hypothetical protein RIQ83_895 [Pseudomonadota bacterium]|jgi:hypothetical protein